MCAPPTPYRSNGHPAPPTTLRSRCQPRSPPQDCPGGLSSRSTKLQSVVEQALANNRNLRAAVANVASVRAQYHVQRSDRLPTLDAGASADLTGGPGAPVPRDTYAVNLGINSFEIDLFGRQKNLTQAAFEQYLATDAGTRAVRITLIGETATAYATLASDGDLLQVSNDTVTNARRSLRLTESLHAAGLASQVDMQEAETVVAQAESDIENYTTRVAQDRNALELLVGAPVDPALLPASLDEIDGGIGAVPAGLSSTVLLQRPDVLQAEHQLIGANANIGAARAAFFPRITLTTAVGLASTTLASLFDRNSRYWSAAPAVSMPVLGGATPGNLEYAKAQREYYLAQYEKTVQSAFRDVADALARRGTIERQRAAQTRLVSASERSYQLANSRYRVGADTFLNALVAQRTLYTARQTQIATALADVSSRINLYQAIASDDAG